MSIRAVHAGYSTIHYKNLPGTSVENLPPADVYVEVVLAFICTMIGSLVKANKLQPVRGGAESLKR